MIEALVSDNIAGARKVKHGFFTRQGGVSEGICASLNCGFKGDDKREAVLENRRRVAQYLDVSGERLLSCDQIHSTTVIKVVEPWAVDNRPQADAMVTKEKGIAIGILTADCGPVLFVDPRAGVIGAAHAGWKGAVGGVLENTISEMEKLGATRGKISAAIGPCIWQDSYEVGSDFLKPFIAENKTNERFFRPSARIGHYMFDLPGYIYARLKGAGIVDISPSPADTLADEGRFFSYRRNCLMGQNTVPSLISAIMLGN